MDDLGYAIRLLLGQVIALVAKLNQMGLVIRYLFCQFIAHCLDDAIFGSGFKVLFGELQRGESELLALLIDDLPNFCTSIPDASEAMVALVMLP